MEAGTACLHAHAAAVLSWVSLLLHRQDPAAAGSVRAGEVVRGQGVRVRAQHVGPPLL